MPSIPEVLSSLASRPDDHEAILKEFLSEENLSIKAMRNLGRQYILKASTNDDAINRATLFSTLLAQQKKIKTIEDMFFFLDVFSNDAKKVIFRAYKSHNDEFAAQPSLKLIKEVGLIGGLQGPFYEGGLLSETNELAKKRFRNLSADSSSPEFVPLAFHLIEDYKNGADFYNPIKKHGDLGGIHSEWEKHAFSFHLIKDGNQTHLIYVNRGQKHELAKGDDPAVKVFTFNSEQTMKLVVSDLVKTLKTKERSKISAFIESSLIPYQNTALTEELQKSKQKVGNCSVANANIAWHYALAAREMKKTGCSFSQAYQNTKEAYKNMRMEDRAKIFCDLMTNPELKVFEKDAVSQIMRKMVKKEEAGKETIRFLLDRLHQKDPDAVKTLFNDLYDSKYNISNSERLQWAKACVNKFKVENINVVEENIEQKIQIMEKQKAENLNGGFESNNNPRDLPSGGGSLPPGNPSNEVQDQGDQIKEECISTYNHIRSRIDLINEHLSAQIARLEPKRGDAFLMKGSDDKIKGFECCQQKLKEYLKNYSQENPPTKEEFMQFQETLLSDIDNISSQRRFTFGVFESTSKGEFNSLKKRLEEIKEPIATEEEHLSPRIE